MKRNGILFALIMTVLSGPLKPQAVYVPLQHWVYEFLDRMEIQELISQQYQTRPFTRTHIAGLFVQIQQQLDEHPDRLSRAESEWFEQLKGEFYQDLPAGAIPVQSRYGERHLLQWKENNQWAVADLDIRQQIDLTRASSVIDDQTVSHTTGGGILRGGLSNKVGFYLFVRNTMIKGEDISEEQFDPADGSPITISGKNAFNDDASAYLTFHLPWLQLMFGRDQVRWGPGRRGQLMLSDHEAYFDMIRMQMAFKRFQFSAIHGKLNYTSARFLAAHRIEFRINDRLSIAGSELVLYGNRSIEPMYLNPLMPYHVAEHHLGDLDNNTMAFDVTLHPRMNHRMFLEIFLDDFTTSENPFTYYGNKWALQSGWHWMNPLGWQGGDVQLEYTRIEPYVYTHTDSINVYKHYGRPIGHWLGPDSDALFFQIGYLYSRELSFAASLERIRHGEGDINDPCETPNGTTKTFLSGIAETDWCIGCHIRFQFMQDGFLNLDYRYHSTNNFQNHNGLDTGYHQVLLDLRVNY